MNQNVVSVRTLFKYYRILHREYFRQNGWNERGWVLTWRYIDRDPSLLDSETLTSDIISLLENITPTARTKKIRKILGLVV